MLTNKSYIRRTWDFISCIATSIVSGLPREKLVLKPESETFLKIKYEKFKSGSEKHFHRPEAKPAVEKQNLRKEKKKVKATH